MLDPLAVRSIGNGLGDVVHGNGNSWTTCGITWTLKPSLLVVVGLVLLMRRTIRWSVRNGVLKPRMALLLPKLISHVWNKPVKGNMLFVKEVWPENLRSTPKRWPDMSFITWVNHMFSQTTFWVVLFKNRTPTPNVVVNCSETEVSLSCAHGVMLVITGWKWRTQTTKLLREKKNPKKTPKKFGKMGNVMSGKRSLDWFTVPPVMGVRRVWSIPPKSSGFSQRFSMQCLWRKKTSWSSESVHTGSHPKEMEDCFGGYYDLESSPQQKESSHRFVHGSG